MTLPFIPPSGPGGFINDAMNANNALANANHLRKYNKEKAYWAPATLQAEAASKLAYANLMGPQYVAKLLQDAGIKGNLTDEQLKSLAQMVTQAGTANSGINTLNHLSQNINRSSLNPFSWIGDKLKSAFNKNQLQPDQQNGNSLNNMGSLPINNNPIPKNAMNLELVGGNRPVNNSFNNKNINNEQPLNNINNEQLSAYDEWLRSPEGKAEIEKGKNGNYPTPQQALEWQQNKQENMVKKGSYGENEGKYKGLTKEGEEAGKFRAQDVHDIGTQQLQLSNTGTNVDKLINDFTDPKFMTLRDKFPFLQDTQLKLLKHTGTKEQQDMIGNIIAELESFKGSTINGFKGQTLKREFDYADKLKPSENDTVYTALGKLRALKSLKEIAWKKNQLISDFIDNNKMSLAKAVQKADKEIDLKSIDQETKDLTQPFITVKNKKNGNYLSFTKARAEELGIPYE